MMPLGDLRSPSTMRSFRKQTEQAAAVVTVTLDDAAPAGGASLDISLVSPLAVSGGEGEISVPDTVIIAEGQTVGAFNVDAVADGRFDGDVEYTYFRHRRRV